MKAGTEVPWVPSRAIALCRAFMDEWMGGIEPGDGFSTAELDAAEQDLGFSIPPLLREFHQLLGKRQDALRLQDPVLAPAELYLDGPDMLVIRQENQGSALWGFPYGDGDDFPIWWKDRHKGSSAVWRTYEQPLSAFLLESLIGESMFSGSVRTVYCYLDEATYRTVGEHFRPLALPPHVYWPIPDGPRLRWYAGDDVLVREEGNNSIWAMGKTDAVYDVMSARLPGDWEWLDS